MKYGLVFIAIASFILACGGSDTTKHAAGEVRQVAADSKPDGAKIYKLYCTTCHGLFGDMGASGAYNLQDSQLTLEERIAVITNGRNAMTAFEKLLKKKEIKAVAEYTFELKNN